MILQANPRLRGVLYDLPPVVAGAKTLRQGSLSSRCEIVAGDFFKTVPSGADAYLLRGIIHNWDDANAVKILKNCREAIRENGTLLLVGEVLNSKGVSNLNGALMDLMMLVLSPGRERTESEYGTLLQTAGFSLTRVIPTRASSSIIEAKSV